MGRPVDYLDCGRLVENGLEGAGGLDQASHFIQEDQGTALAEAIIAWLG